MVAGVEAPRTRGRRREGVPHEDALVDRLTELETLIVGTVPATQEGAVVVTLALLRYQAESPGVGLDVDAEAGQTLARFILQHAPAELLTRLEVAPAELVAGLEAG